MADLTPTGASLLGFLFEQPMTGYALMQAIDESVGNFWNVTRSQVYSELKRLAGGGLLREGKAAERNKQPYTITAKGKAAFLEWIAGPPGPELIRIPLALTVFFRKHVDPQLMRRYAAAHRERHAAQLAMYRDIRKMGLAANPNCDTGALDLGILWEEMMVRWIDGL